MLGDYKAALLSSSCRTPRSNGWRGYLTLELTRYLHWPIYLKPGTPIAQVRFEPLDEPTEEPNDGKCQDQSIDPQLAILEQN